MEWISDKVMNDYHLFNKLVFNTIKKRYPNLEYFEITEESFNKLFLPERQSWGYPSLELIMCVDFNRFDIDNMTDIGIDASSFITNAFRVIFTDSNIFEHYNYIMIDKFHLNKTEYCKGKVEYTVN